MHNPNFIDFCILCFTAIVLILFTVRLFLLFIFFLRYDYESPFVMLFLQFPTGDVKNTFHLKMKHLKQLYNKTTLPFLLFGLLVVSLKIFLSLIH